MTRYKLDELRRRYVIEGRPLEAGVEEILRADTRAGARAILASIERRRFENRSEGQRFARCCALRRFYGMRARMPLRALTRPE